MIKSILFSLLGFILSENLQAQRSIRLYNKGLNLANRENYKSAIVFLDRAIRNDPLFYQAWYNRALCKSRIKDFEAAIHDYSKCIALNPSFSLAYNNRGADKNDMGDVEGALNDYAKAIQLDTTYTRAYFNRGIVWYELKDFQKATEIRPDYADAIQKREVLLLALVGKIQK